MASTALCIANYADALYILIEPATSTRCTLNRTYRLQGKKFSSFVWHGIVHILSLLRRISRIPCFITSEASIRCQKIPEVGIRRIPPNTPLFISNVYA